MRQNFSTSVGLNAGKHAQQMYALALGGHTGEFIKVISIVVGTSSGLNQGDRAVAFGYTAGQIGWC